MIAAPLLMTRSMSPLTLPAHRSLDATTLIRRAARYNGARDALVWESGRRTYAELMMRVEAVAASLSLRSIGPGDRVALCLRNAPSFLEAYLAILQLGAICVPLNFRLAPGEVTYLVKDSGPSLLIADQETERTVREAELPPGCPVFVDGIGDGPGSYESLVRDGLGQVAPRPTIDLNAPASLLYTSGTTGAPKGVVRSQLALCTLIALRQGAMEIGAETVLLAPTPLFNAGGHEFMLLETLAAGGCVVLRRRFDVPEIIDLVARERITHAYFVPTMGFRLMEAMDRNLAADWSSLKMWMSASAPLPDALRERIRTRLPHVGLWNSYGITEVGAVSFLRPVDIDRKPGTCVGRPGVGVEVRCVDDKGEDVAPGQAGEIVCRSPEAMSEYWNNPKATASAVRDGWIHTGDIGAIDAEGFLNLLDRLKDIVITGGDNVYASEVENHLASCPAVREVAIIGVPHPEWGECVVAVAVAAEGALNVEAAVQAFARSGLARYKCPKSVILVPELPRSEYGKVLKAELRRQYAGLFQ